jgi:hypothetical protein
MVGRGQAFESPLRLKVDHCAGATQVDAPEDDWSGPEPDASWTAPILSDGWDLIEAT